MELACASLDCARAARVPCRAQAGQSHVAAPAQLAPAASPTMIPAAMAVSSTAHFMRRRVAMLLRCGTIFNLAHLLRSRLRLVVFKRTMLIVAVHRPLISPLDGRAVLKARILFCGARRAELLEALPLVSALDGSMVLNGVTSTKFASPGRRRNFRTSVVNRGPLHAV